MATSVREPQTTVLPDSRIRLGHDHPDEIREFADVLGVRPEALRGLRYAESAEAETFDYDELVADPIKSIVARNDDYFAQLKVDLTLELTARAFGRQRLDELSVLDIGCGTGHMMRRLTSHFADVHGCDLSQSMVRRAGKNASLMPAPTRVPFTSESFDIAICACVYHHVRPELRLEHVGEVARVLRPGGMLLIFEHNPRNPLTRRIVRRCPIDESAILVGSRQMRSILKAARFTDIRCRHYLFMPESIYRHLGFAERWLSLSGMGGQYCTTGRVSHTPS